VVRAGLDGWVRRTGAVFQGDVGGSDNRAYPLVLTTVIAAGARGVTQQGDDAAAAAFADDFLALLDRFPAV
jgi:hypothetical protein